MVTGIKHIAIAVRDVESAAHHYEAVLGLNHMRRFEFERARSSEAHFMLNGVEMQLCQSWDADGRFSQFLIEHGAEGVHHICYTVDDIEATISEAIERGARLKMCSSCKVVGPHKHSEGWVAFLDDKLTGLETEFMQVYKAGEGPDVQARTA